MQISWFMPLGVNRNGSTLESLKEVAVAYDELGYYGSLFPVAGPCLDAWLSGAVLAAATKRLRMMIAVRPTATAPHAAALMATTFEQFSNGRLLVNVISGNGAKPLAHEGLTLAHDDRYEATDEFLTIWSALLRGEDVTFSGRYYAIQNGKLPVPAVQKPGPTIYFSGSSPAALPVAARHAEVHLSQGEPPEVLARKNARIRQLAAEQGRNIRFGVRLEVIVRETEEAAWKAAEELLRPVSDTAVAYLAEQLKQSPNNYLVEPGGAASALHDLLRQVEEDGARNGVRLNGTRRDNLEVAPNLWAGLRLLRPGRTLTLVGDPVSAAARLQEYAAMGVDTFILNNTPHLDQAKNFAKLVFPLLPLDHGWEVPGSGTASIPGVKRTSDVPDRFRPVSLAPDGFTSANSKSEEVVSAG